MKLSESQERALERLCKHTGWWFPSGTSGHLRRTVESLEKLGLVETQFRQYGKERFQTNGKWGKWKPLYTKQYRAIVPTTLQSQGVKVGR